MGQSNLSIGPLIFNCDQNIDRRHFRPIATNTLSGSTVPSGPQALHVPSAQSTSICFSPASANAPGEIGAHTEHLRLTPWVYVLPLRDVFTVAKSLGAGMPIAAVVGRREIMDAVHAGGLGGTYRPPGGQVPSARPTPPLA